MVNFEFNPDFEASVGKLVIDKANEAVAALGATDGESAEQIAARLASELERRGINLPPEALATASEAIASGQAFEFR